MMRTVSVAAAAGLLAACGSGEPSYETVLVLDAGRDTLIVEATEPDSADAPVLLRVRRQDVDNGILYSGQIANGGQPVGPDNVRADGSRAGHLWLCLNGTGQSDVAVSINLQNNLVVEDPRPCRD